MSERFSSRDEVIRFEPRVSAQPCGCDPGAAYLCERHLKERDETIREMNDIVQKIDRRIADRVYQQSLERETQMKDTEPAIAAVWTPSRIGPTRPVLPTDPKLRKEYPIFTGLLQYFPDACAEVAHVSYVGNQQHNPGQPLHWDRSKSMDQGDTQLRHMMEGGPGPAGRDTDGARHSAKAAWRALAALQLEIEEERARGEAA